MLPEDMEILPPSDDRVFKLLLTSEEGSGPVLADLISATIGEPVTEVTVRNNELPSNDTEEKDQRFDVNCIMGPNRQADIEMQASYIQETPGGKHDNLKGKSVYICVICTLRKAQEGKGGTINCLERIRSRFVPIQYSLRGKAFFTPFPCETTRTTSC